jgi:hypothetical protein
MTGGRAKVVEHLASVRPWVQCPVIQKAKLRNENKIKKALSSLPQRYSAIIFSYAKPVSIMSSP